MAKKKCHPQKSRKRQQPAVKRLRRRRLKIDAIRKVVGDDSKLTGKNAEQFSDEDKQLYRQWQENRKHWKEHGTLPPRGIERVRKETSNV